MDREIVFRVLFAVVVIGNVGTSGYFRRRAREVEEIPRSAESAGLRWARVVFTLPLLFGLLAYLAYPRAIEWSRFPLADSWRFLGAVLGVSLVPWMVWVFRTLGSNVSETVLTKENHRLVVEGPYRWIRHPIYTTGIAMIVSFALISANVLFLAIAGVAVLLFRFGIIPREEQALIDRFGEQYESYRSGTGALLPRLGSPD